jgi:hypothetical protein
VSERDNSHMSIMTNHTCRIGSLILFGIGVGVGGQQALMAAQTVFEGTDASLAMSALIFVQTLGGTIFLCVAQNVFEFRLVAELANHVPEADPRVVIQAGASELANAMRKSYSDMIVTGILNAYNTALQQVFLIAVILASLSIVGAVFVEWRSVKKNKISKAAPDVESVRAVHTDA